jgi:hypothetical protein
VKLFLQKLLSFKPLLLPTIFLVAATACDSPEEADQVIGTSPTVTTPTANSSTTTPVTGRPILYAGQTTLNFGAVQNNTSLAQVLEVTNIGTAAGIVQTLADSGSSTYVVSADTCSGIVLAIGASCTALVTFTPTSAITFSGAVSIPYTDAAAAAFTLAQNLTGNGTTGATVRPIILTAGSSLAFPLTSTNASNSLTLTLINSGTDLANFGTAGFTASVGSVTALSITTDNCSNHALLAGSSCTLTVEFSPTAAGSYAGVWSLAYTGSTSPSSYTVSVPYTGTAVVPQPVVTSNPTTYNFGTISPGSTLTNTFSIANNSAGSATFQAATISGSGFSIQSGDDGCSTDVLTATSTPSSCNVVVSFSPTNVGSQTGTLTLNYTPVNPLNENATVAAIPAPVNVLVTLDEIFCCEVNPKDKTLV